MADRSRSDPRRGAGPARTPPTPNVATAPFLDRPVLAVVTGLTLVSLLGAIAIYG